MTLLARPPDPLSNREGSSVNIVGCGRKPYNSRMRARRLRLILEYTLLAQYPTGTIEVNLWDYWEYVRIILPRKG